MDEKGFTNRVKIIRGKLYKTAYLYLGEETSALNTVDEAIYKAMLSLKKLRRPEYFDTWISRILINECRNKLRRKELEIPMGTLNEKSVEQFNSVSLKEAVQCLPKDLKEPVILRLFAGSTTEETARILKIKYSTAVSRLRRAIKLLKFKRMEEVNVNEPQ